MEEETKNSTQGEVSKNETNKQENEDNKNGENTKIHNHKKNKNTKKVVENMDENENLSVSKNDIEIDIENQKSEVLSDKNHENDNEELLEYKRQVEEGKDKYLRLYSEFDNFRRRSAKEKLELVHTANMDLMTDLVPVLDDFERAKKSFGENDKLDLTIIQEGFDLIHTKFEKILNKNGLTAMDNSVGIEFNPDFHEAITQIPAPKKNLKGKVVDVIEKGYMLKEKVLRYAKVVIGQ